MAWSSEKEAGFALAAWLADDRELRHVDGAIEPAQLAVLHRRSAAPGTRLPGSHRTPPAAETAPTKVEAVQQLLRVLRPALDERALGLPVRARALLARLAPAPLRKRLLEGSSPSRAHYHADEELIALLLRAARNAQPGKAP